MGTFLSPNGTLRSIQSHPLVDPGANLGPSLNSCYKCHQLGFRNASLRRRNFMFAGNLISRSLRTVVFAKKKGSSSDRSNSDGELRDKEEELMEAKRALAEAKAIQEAIEKERDQLLEELSKSDAKQQEYIATVIHDKELALTELNTAKSMFQQKLEETVEEKSTLESRLVLARQDSVDLAVQVEKLAEISFQRSTSKVLEDAQLRVSAAETSAAEAACKFEEQIRNATEGTIASIVEQSKDAIEKALVVAERAGEYATSAVTAFSDVINPADEIALVQSEKFMLQDAVSNLESQLLLTRNEVDKLKSELEQARARGKESELRANNVEKALAEFQDSSGKRVMKQEEEIKLFLEKMKEEAEEKKEKITETFKTDLDGIKAAIEAAKQTARSKDDAYVRRCEALQRSLKASEGAKSTWQQRAESAESLLLKKTQSGEEEEDVVYMLNGGRIDLLTDDDSLKWKLLSDGPRREIPQWMARKIRSVSPRFPPRKVDVSEALTSKFRTLDLPKPDQVWSIAKEKPREGDTFVEHVIEEEVLIKKRKDLDRVLKEDADKYKKVTPEEKKLESGTGTGREIVFQGFNWESWRRQWYLELAPKAADLRKVGITSIWLPPPTESVAPQGYMPSDLYNLNSAYGTVEELKHCIKEMHAHDILVLGDVVLNHRCAHKQSPNGVWNIFGGKLAWGPEAIVCDDPNFQGRGNPSSGDIFHAAPNVDHSQEFVRKDIKEWLNWLKSDIGFDGWRLDFVRGFSGTHVREYIDVSKPAFAIGEYWDSLAYENGDLCYNQDAHRQRIVNWINATGGTSSAFDVTTKGILHSALHNQYWRLIDPSGKPPGVMGWWPSRAVTFLENHDTGSTQGHWPFPRDKLTQGYAYILTHPGTPVVFYDHLYDFGIRDVITELIETRRKAGIHCRSTVKILHANNEGYVAHVNETLVMKMGHFDWNPSKELHLDGSWARIMDKGADYQLWLRQ